MLKYINNIKQKNNHINNIKQKNNFINNIKLENIIRGDCGYTTSSEKRINKKTRMSEANESE